MGATGPTGPRGAIGPTGPAGASIIGPTGPAGSSIIGPTGPTGPGFDVDGLVRVVAFSWRHDQPAKLLRLANGTAVLAIAFGRRLGDPAAVSFRSLTEAFEGFVLRAVTGGGAAPVMAPYQRILARMVPLEILRFDTNDSRLIAEARQMNVNTRACTGVGLLLTQEIEAVLSELGQGIRIYMHLRGDLVFDADERPIAATYDGVNLPTGHYPGGTLWSWFILER